MTTNEMNILIFGEYGVGKRALQSRFHHGLFLTHQEFEEEYSFSKSIEFNGTTMNVTSTNIIWREFKRKTDERVIKADGFLLMYSIIKRDTFLHLQEIYNSLVQIRETERIPIVVVGNKCDREEYREVSAEEGRTFAERINAPFIEISIRCEINVNEAFYELFRLIEEQRNQSKQSQQSLCVIC